MLSTKRKPLRKTFSRTMSFIICASSVASARRWFGAPPNRRRCFDAGTPSSCGPRGGRTRLSTARANGRRLPVAACTAQGHTISLTDHHDSDLRRLLSQRASRPRSASSKSGRIIPLIWRCFLAMVSLPSAPSASFRPYSKPSARPSPAAINWYTSPGGNGVRSRRRLAPLPARARTRRRPERPPAARPYPSFAEPRAIAPFVCLSEHPFTRAPPHSRSTRLLAVFPAAGLSTSARCELRARSRTVDATSGPRFADRLAVRPTASNRLSSG